MSPYTGQIVTVEGPIEPENLGTTITHEHVFSDLSNWLSVPDSAYEKELVSGPVTMDKLWYLRRNPQCSADNYLLGSFDEAVDELAYYLRAGGDSVVDVTPKGVGQDPEGVRAVSRETGLNVVQGTAYYVKSGHPDRIQRMEVEELASEFQDDVVNGIGGTEIPAGIIGEIGLSVDSAAEIHDDELKVLRAAARAALETGAPVSIHPPGRTETAQRDRSYPSSRWCLDILDVLEDEGLPPDRAIMGHMDRTVFEDIAYHKELAERGPYLEYDLWGSEFYHDPYADGYPSDWWRVDVVSELVDDGFGDQVLFSHDVCSKIRRRKYGGAGYAHILEHGIPMLRRAGVSEESIDRIMVENPRNVLTFRSSN